MDLRPGRPREQTADASGLLIGNERARNSHQNLLGMT